MQQVECIPAACCACLLQSVAAGPRVNAGVGNTCLKASDICECPSGVYYAVHRIIKTEMLLLLCGSRCQRRLGVQVCI
jgi:hypothetical protein